MTVGPLVEKELRWLRRNWRAVTLVFLLAPLCLGLATATFDRTLPRDVPVAVVPADDTVTQDELQAAAGLTRSVAAPRHFDSVDAARTALDREHVYGVLSVEHGLYDAGANVTLSFAVAGGMVTYVEPSQVVTATLRDRATIFPSTVIITHETLDPQRTLPEFLFATGLVYLLAGYAFTYVPYHLARERRVFERVRVESSLWSLLAAKGVLFAALGTLALASMGALGVALGYRVALANPVALAVLALTGTSLVATGLGISFLTRFSVAGRFSTVALLGAVVAFSNPVYPSGFFSVVRRTISGVSPVYHATVVVRGLTLSGRTPGLYIDRLVLICGLTVASLAFLGVAVLSYERRGRDG